MHDSTAQECKPRSPRSKSMSARIYAVMYDGPLTPSQSSPSEALRHCVSREKHAENMREFFLSYGVNLTAVKNDPYSPYDGADYSLQVFNVNDPAYRIYFGSQPGYSKFMNTQVIFTDWTLASKSSHTGPRGTIPAGFQLFYGMCRFKDNGTNVCVEYHSRIPFIFDPSTSTLLVDSLLYNEEWGLGDARGFASSWPNTSSHRSFLTFPVSPS